MEASVTFRQRCEAALTHPVTLSAIALFLLNDLALKPAWPDAWLTGKLSDLAFVVFASPLLAFFLSLLVRGSHRRGRLVLAIAYVGLPLLYAAFNTFTGVHGPIVQLLALANGSPTQSPLDVTDSLVILPGLTLGLWVWRRPARAFSASRRRLSLIVVGLAALASIATSPPEVEWGVRFEQDAVTTPRGVYSIEGTDILHDGRVVYSTDHLREDANVWLQVRDTRHLQERRITTEPYGIRYDEATGNVIVGMGILGVLIGTPDGEWVPQAEGRYRPTDFSRSARRRALFADGLFWALWFGMAMSALVAGILIADFRRERLQWALLGLVLAVPTAVVWPLVMVLGALAIFFVLFWGFAIVAAIVPFVLPHVVLPDGGLPHGEALLMLAAFGAPVLAVIAVMVGASGERTQREQLQDALGPAGLYLSAAGLATFGWLRLGSSHHDLTEIDGRVFIFAIAGLVLSIAVVSGSWRRARYWRSAVMAFLAALGGVLLAFMWWAQLGDGLLFAKIAAVVLVALVATTFGLHVRRLERAAESALEAVPD